MTIRALIEAVERGEWTVTHWRNFAAVPTGNNNNNNNTPGPILAHRAYHGSLDAAIALHEALLPGWGCRTEIWAHGGLAAAEVWPGEWGRPNRADASAYTPARAWLLAILRAVEAGATK